MWLYYPAVSPVHAPIVFNDDRKAFLGVCGMAGISADGYLVCPNALEGGQGKGGKTQTTALGNESEIEKQFRFTYPPKELRKALAVSPARTDSPPQAPQQRTPPLHDRRRALLPAVSPGVPLPDPCQNLRVLQSPLRIPPASFAAPASLRTPSPSPARRTWS
ncbi:hypothetical protein FB451DRAFT_1390979 [Mycena latifolia]|nr:hypothetical protein FB451DRAFT_1390979 [Mycena latifolia]